jgi:hypothetical protein
MGTTGQQIIAGIPEPEAPEITAPNSGQVPPAKKKRSGTPGATRARRARAAGAPTRPAGRPPRPSLADRLTNSIVMVGAGVAIANQADGEAIINGAGDLADALVKLGEEKPRVRQALESMLSASAYAGVMAATLPIVAAIAANHGVLPAGVLDALVQPAAPETPPAPAPEATPLRPVAAAAP